nr:XrtB/PEP-CTERM-associated polysaccharide biosynthesis outer membrane protein EpsL [uncultured Duganella sp.]
MPSPLRNRGAARPVPPTPARRPRWTPAGAAVLAALLASAPALAQLSQQPPQLSDTLHPFVTVGYTHEENLMRLSDDERDRVDGGGSDNVRSVAVGVALERPIGRQLLTGSARVSRVSYDHFSQFDYNGSDAAGDLAWALGNHWGGHAGASYGKTLVPFGDNRSTERNLRTQRRLYGDAAWTFHPSWRLVASYSNTDYDYELDAQRYNNRSERLVAAGFDYLATSGSTFGMQFRRLSGRYDNDRAGAGVLFDNNYTQDEQKLNINWLVTPSTRLLFLGGFVQRKHEFMNSRDDSGANGRLIASWDARARLRFNGQLWREFSATEGTIINSALSTGASLGATWDVTAKISVDAQGKRDRRRFDTIAGVTSGLAPGALNDTTRTVSAGLTYRPRPTIELALRAFRDSRTGSPPAGTVSYTANGASFTASAQF